MALTYALGFAPPLQVGDVISEEKPGVISDVLRFNPEEHCGSSVGCLVVYSDNTDDSDSKADIGLPTAFYTNMVTLPEASNGEADDGLNYSPSLDQPGAVLDTLPPQGKLHLL